jgi:hypothetical protein
MRADERLIQCESVKSIGEENVRELNSTPPRQKFELIDYKYAWVHTESFSSTIHTQSELQNVIFVSTNEYTLNNFL